MGALARWNCRESRAENNPRQRNARNDDSPLRAVLLPYLATPKGPAPASPAALYDVEPALAFA